jgi:hypothetical protein
MPKHVQISTTPSARVMNSCGKLFRAGFPEIRPLNIWTQLLTAHFPTSRALNGRAIFSWRHLVWVGTIQPLVHIGLTNFPEFRRHSPGCS